jgi:type IV pilus assembly protein PilF
MTRLRMTLLLLAVGLLLNCGAKAPVENQAESTAVGKIRLSHSLLAAGRLNEALAALDEAIEAEPDRAVIYHNRGLICLQGGRLEDAEEAFQKVLSLDPSYTDAHNFLGVVYKELGKPVEAEEQFKAALADPVYQTPQMVYLNLGLLYRSEGRDKDALGQFRRSVEIDPKFYKGHFELASTLDLLGELKEAAREYEVAAPAYRQSGNYFYRLGLTYFRLGDKPRAGENLRRVIDIAPGSEDSARADDLLEMLD